MDSDDEDFVVSAPTKKTKKNEKADGEEKGKKKKGSATKGDRVSTSPKRKTPKGKKNENKEEGKKAKGKGKAKEKAKKTEEPEELAEPAENGEGGEGGEDDLGSFNPGDDDDDFSAGGSDAEEEKGKKKKEKEKKAPKAKKEKGGVRDSDEEDILEYMKKQNRPYSLQNIYDNLHAKIKKTAMQKALDSLVDEGQLQMKEFGKAKLYLLNQQNIPQVSAKEMDKMKDGMNKAKQEHTKLTEEVKEMGHYLKNLTNQLTNEQLDHEIEKYQQLVEEDKKKLELYESGNYPKISDDDMKKAEEKRKKFETEFKKRKRMCLDMLNSIADFMEQKLTNVMESVGIEVD